MPRYRALKMGTLPGDIRVREGEEFEFRGPRGAWMAPVEEAEAHSPAPAEGEVEAESQPEAPVVESKRGRKRKESE